MVTAVSKELPISVLAVREILAVTNQYGHLVSSSQLLFKNIKLLVPLFVLYSRQREHVTNS